jgi:hypothetical protein
MNIDWNIVSGLAAAAATAISLIAWRSAHRSQDRMEQLAARQDRLAHQAWTDDYFRDITNWAGQVCHAISRAIHLVGVNDDHARREVLVELSASIDMGRWYFPNQDHDSLMIEKEPAYRGVRQPILDWIVTAYDICHKESRSAQPHATLVGCQRQFVSAIQEVLDPRSRDSAIKRVLNDFRSVSALPKVESPPE